MTLSNSWRVACVAALLAAGCGNEATGPSTDEGADDRGATLAAYSQARARWAATRPPAYRYTLRVLCFCTPAVTTPVTVTVRGSAVADLVRADGSRVEPDLVPLFPSVDGIFDRIGQAIAEGAAEVRVSYDPATGMPTEVFIDEDRRLADEELRYEAGGLQPLG